MLKLFGLSLKTTGITGLCDAAPDRHRRHDLHLTTGLAIDYGDMSAD